MAERVLLLPGGTGPVASKPTYDLLLKGAQERGLECQIVYYPGHRPDDGEMTYEGALKAAAQLAAELRPTWVVGRSLGCNVACGLLASGADWVPDCRGAALWGAGRRSDFRAWRTAKKRKEFFETMQAKGVQCAPDFFESLQHLDELIPSVPCNLRLARGTGDNSTKLRSLAFLASLHAKHQNAGGHECEVVEVVRLDHSVKEGGNPVLLQRYLSIMFNQIV